MDSPSERWYYDYAGLRVTSEIDLPEWTVFEQSRHFAESDVIISLNPAAEENPSTNNFHHVTPDEYHFFIADSGEYRVRHGREIVVAPAPNAGAREVRLFLLGSAWGALCYQRGILALHSSVVQIGDHAIAFCGETGAGKSSIAAWLVAHGYLLVSDDLTRFDVANGTARIYPSAPRLKLWRDALTEMNWSAEKLERDHFRLDKFHIADLPGLRRPGRSVPLRAIYLLAWGEPSIARLTGMDALRQLVATATYRRELLEPMGQVAAHWQRCAELARCVSVYQFTRPRDWTTQDATMKMLIEQTSTPID